jgi:hypothetical protein
VHDVRHADEGRGARGKGDGVVREVPAMKPGTGKGE